MSICYIEKKNYLPCLLHKELPNKLLLCTQQSGAGLSDVKGVAGRASKWGGESGRASKWGSRGVSKTTTRAPAFPSHRLAGLACNTNPPSFDPSLFVFWFEFAFLLKHSQHVPISIFSTSRQEIPRGGWFMVDCALLLLLLSTLEIPVHEGSSACCHQ